MTSYDRGDVVLVHYDDVGREGRRLRPALVVSSQTYQQGREQLIVAAITGNYSSLQPGDSAAQAWKAAGLLDASVVTGVLVTVSPNAILRTLGSMDPDDLRTVESSLRVSLGL